MEHFVAAAPPPPPPLPGGPAPPPPPGLAPVPTKKEPTVLELVRKQRALVRKLKFAPSEKAKESKGRGPLADITPTEQLLINRRLKLQKDYDEVNAGLYREYVEAIKDVDFTHSETADAVGQQLLYISTNILQPLGALPGELPRLPYFVTADGLVWPLERSSVAEAYRLMEASYRSLLEDIEAMKKLVGPTPKETWDTVDLRYLALDKRVKQMISDTTAVVDVESADGAADNEQELRRKAGELGQELTMTELKVTVQQLPLEEALRRIGVRESVAADFAKRRRKSMEELQRQFETAYFVKAANALAGMWNDYYRAVERGSSTALVERKFTQLLNAAFLFGGKRLGTDKRLEKYFESVGVGQFMSNVLKKILNELETARAQMPLDRVTVDSHCDFCGKPGQVSSCSKCELVDYCSVTCQAEHWAEHRKACK